MNGMFAGCTSITYLNVTNYNTSQIINTNTMFYRCAHLTFGQMQLLFSLDLNTFDTSQATIMEGMFDGSYSLLTLDKVILIYHWLKIY